MPLWKEIKLLLGAFDPAAIAQCQSVSRRVGIFGQMQDSSKSVITCVPASTCVAGLAIDQSNVQADPDILDEAPACARVRHERAANPNGRNP